MQRLFLVRGGLESYYHVFYLDSHNHSPHYNTHTNFNGWEVHVSKKVKFEGFFAWPLIFYRQKLCKIIFASLKNLFSVIRGFRIPVSDSGFQFPIPDSGFQLLGLPLHG